MTKFNKDFRLKLVMEVDQGNPLQAVAKRYGVDRNTLRAWYTKYSHGGVDQLFSVNRRYTQEFKINAVEYRRQNDLSYRLAAADLGIPSEGVLCQWEKRYLEYGVSGLQTTKKGRPPKVPEKKEKPKSDLNREELLEAENAQLRMENAYLKKLNALVEEREKSKKKTK